MSLTAEYVRRAKAHFGNEYMSDRELGEHIGASGPVVSQARYGSMSDPVAIRIARALQIDAGEVIMVARAEREKDPEVKAELEAYMSKTLAAVPRTTAPIEQRGGMAAMVQQLTAASPEAQKVRRPRGAPQKGVGGNGGIRTLDAGFAHILP
jgi:hypothetical protein